MGKLPTRTIKPGELHVSETPCRIKTLLGSCVSVTVHNTKSGFGGMNHFMLPEYIPSRANGDNDFRFGDRSIRWMLDRMLEYDDNISNLDVKLFGGGRVVAALARSGIGQKNINVALDVLDDYGLEPSKRLVSQSHGLKLDFNTRTNTVRVQLIQQSDESIDESTRRELKENKNRVSDILSGEDDGETIDFLSGE
ncbi:MAG: chemotaxis protein CheD [bacterium]